MNLTPEQRAVVELSSGRHLVLAPPGSGKTEMLSQRIVLALNAGVRPERMLCATFTNRAAFEMRDRVATVADGKILPEVGNIHHFCHRFLCSVGRLQPGRYVLDEMQQLEFVQEVVDVLRLELCTGQAADLKRTHGLSVMGMIRGICEPMRLRLREVVESLMADFEKRGVSPYADILTAAQVVHQRKCGIPPCYLRQMPPSMYDLAADGVIDAIEVSYRGLKRKFRVVDFDDLVNETYLFLTQHPLPEEQRYEWVQVDEVQDLNPLQWRIVRELTTTSAVSVYFGDVEQSIFSFLGASSFQFASAVSDCERHFFKTNFRATPLLLEILMRYSLDALRSEWEFLPAPADVSRADGEVRLTEESSSDLIVSHVRRLLDQKIAESVAVLVRDNCSADVYENLLRSLGYRYVKVSGIDLFATALMRDFLAFVSLLGENPSMAAWAALVRRFAEGIHTRAQARYFVRGMFAFGFDPLALFANKSPIPRTPLHESRASRWAWSHRRVLVSLRSRLTPLVERMLPRLEGSLRFRDFFDVFSELALSDEVFYSKRELWPELRRDREALDEIPHAAAQAHAVERIEVFLRYADFIYRDETRPWRELWAEDGARLAKLKEADLLVGDEKIVISTIHKAKGRQFDAVVVPNVESVISATGGADADESLRLLYVAMSRAKRHLTLFGCGQDELFNGIKECFAPEYVGYYARRARGWDMAGEWLAKWEELAVLNRKRECPKEQVLQALHSPAKPVVRMALKVLRHCADRGFVMEQYRPFIKGEYGDTVIACLGDCAWLDKSVLAEIREAAIVTKWNRVRAAALMLCGRLLVARAECPGLSGSRRIVDRVSDLSAELRTIVADMLYAYAGDIRHEAAILSAACGDRRFEKLVTGSFVDFKRLSAIPAPEHEATIRAILATNPPARHASALRDLLYSRATFHPL